VVFSIGRLAFVDLIFSVLPERPLQGVNVLIVGIDNTERVQRSDTLMVMHLDKARNRIGLLSVPRDTRVNVPDVGITKINHAYSHGGIRLLRQTVSSFLNIPIDQYVQVNIRGVETIIDEIGGIDIKIEKDLYYADHAGGALY